MAAKVKTKKSFLNRELDHGTESVAIASAFTVLFAVFTKLLVVALPLGLLFAFLHHKGLKRKQK